MIKRFGLGLAVACGLGLAAAAQGAYTINGMPVDSQTHAYLAGVGLPAGHYWLLPNGNWGVMGNLQPLGNIYAGTTHGSGVYGGSGQTYGNGSWSYYSGDYGPSGGVGGDGNGCIYAGDWSNC
ncbi:MAG: hypothetical protein AAGC57_02225 [Pseudomonadota bacterium]